ncbi:hypothetical protein BLNAU_10 [Blattamonas nauphoetae]|uniref:RING-type domain-containing protein n=1 Tax=Blattamonas nauphoetae TaxID=2049346 RepID=A0ABQ9YLS5_9EUKA|nr:hypothetical protein BLNAU_10 [Blattamonas nauphoetae]
MENEEYSNLRDCSICLCSFDTTSHQPFSLKCGHVFGKDCISQWAKSNKRCPECRKDFNANDGRTLVIPTGVTFHKRNEDDEKNYSRLQELAGRCTEIQRQITRMQVVLIRKRKEQSHTTAKLQTPKRSVSIQTCETPPPSPISGNSSPRLFPSSFDDDSDWKSQKSTKQ